MEMVPVIIPDYKPDDRQLILLNGLTRLGNIPIILVNDGRGDEYSRFYQEAVDKYRVILLAHEGNRGKGATLKTAFKYCIKNMEDLTGNITADSDVHYIWHAPDNAVVSNSQKLRRLCHSPTLSGSLESNLKEKFPDIYREISVIAMLQLVTGCRGKRIRREFEASYLNDIHPDLACSDYTVRSLIGKLGARSGDVAAFMHLYMKPGSKLITRHFLMNLVQYL